MKFPVLHVEKIERLLESLLFFSERRGSCLCQIVVRHVLNTVHIFDLLFVETTRYLSFERLDIDSFYCFICLVLGFLSTLVVYIPCNLALYDRSFQLWRILMKNVKKKSNPDDVNANQRRLYYPILNSAVSFPLR